jgi:regulation of enolase protein 1 (concanavalin A-like superfamily)
MFDNWLNKPDNYEITEDVITIHAPANTDYFRDPLSAYARHNAPFLYRETSSDFTFSCDIRPEFRQTYDAGTILFYADAEHWLKLAFENTDLGYPAVVSVVTRGKSDDCNGEQIESAFLSVKLSRKGNVLGAYYAAGNTGWKMLRLCELECSPRGKALIGIAAQSPMGNGCTVRFSHIRFLDTPVGDFRKGR